MQQNIDAHFWASKLKKITFDGMAMIQNIQNIWDADNLKLSNVWKHSRLESNLKLTETSEWESGPTEQGTAVHI